MLGHNGCLAADDRFGQNRKVFGVMAFMVKVATQDTEGHCLIIEQANDYQGGPPRHKHLHQEEWFLVLEGRYTIEINGVPHLLNAGDAILAPRNIPHAWALTGSSGRMLIGFYPAGQMEAFFNEATQLTHLPPHPDLKDLFARHNMEITGPPLQPPGHP